MYILYLLTEVIKRIAQSFVWVDNILEDSLILCNTLFAKLIIVFSFTWVL